MRIVIDMQGAQTESRFRGIGRYTLSFVQAVVRNRGEHEIILALSDQFPESIKSLRSSFSDSLPKENIRVWQSQGPVNWLHPSNEFRREIAEIMRESFLASLEPDVLHLSSLFEGYGDDAVTSIGRFDLHTPVSVMIYDLIPLLNPDKYLESNPNFKGYYFRKLKYLHRANRFFAISEFTRTESIENLNLSNDCVFNISTAIEDSFPTQNPSSTIAQGLIDKHSLVRPFALYAGGADERKNLPRLILAWGSLPWEIQRKHQLVFVGKMPESEILNLKQIANNAGIDESGIRFTGYVSDEELFCLYKLCKIFVFPSWHEGFGIPALEAMACGAPLIAANTSSLPEVIGIEDALFDPLNISSIANKLTEALQDETFRARIQEHGLRHAKKFSWDSVAKRAISAWSSMPRKQSLGYYERTSNERRLYDSLSKFIFSAGKSDLISISKCLAQNQLAGLERQLLIDVSEICQRDSATGVQRVVRSYLQWLLNYPPAGFRVEPVYATLTDGYRYARKFMSDFLADHSPMLVDDPVRWKRGDIFFGLDMQHHVQLAHRSFYKKIRQEGVVVKFLVHDLLPIQLADYFKDSDAKVLHEKWLSMLSAFDGVVCVSKATSDALDKWITQNNIYKSPNFSIHWVHNGADILGSRPSLGLPTDAADILDQLQRCPTFLCVSTLEPRKQQLQVLGAIEFLWQKEINVNLVFVGKLGWKYDNLADQINNHNELGKRLFWLQGVSDEYLEKVYEASTCLIAASLNEGFGLSLIESARHGLPIIARDIPIFREVAGAHAEYFHGETSQDLASVLCTWLGNYSLNTHQPSIGMKWLSWRESTEILKSTLINYNYPRQQLLVDISELIKHDAKTGIQRVVRNILNEWLNNPPEGYRVEPVYATAEHSYRYARDFKSHFLKDNQDSLLDDPIEFSPGDIFFGLDLQPSIQVHYRNFYASLRQAGVTVKFMVYDLLCVLMPHYFLEGSAVGLSNWLEVVAESDGAVCISNSVANEFEEWVKKNEKKCHADFCVNFFHLGADLDNSDSSFGFPSTAEHVLVECAKKPTFLMVGTLEPRKGHTQVIKAFEEMWSMNVDINLAIVGKQGWMVESLISSIKNHPELHKRLFWLEGISDEFLDKMYNISTCLIIASYGEGFGLPLIEAAQKGLPILARDIPVFREVAGDHAYYFEANTSADLSTAIQDWLILFHSGQHPSSNKISWLSWKQSAAECIKILLNSSVHPTHLQ